MYPRDTPTIIREVGSLCGLFQKQSSLQTEDSINICQIYQCVFFRLSCTGVHEIKGKEDTASSSPFLGITRTTSVVYHSLCMTRMLDVQVTLGELQSCKLNIGHMGLKTLITRVKSEVNLR